MSQYPQQYQRPTQLQIDYNQGVWLAYLNCVNSFQQPDFASENMPGQGIMRSASKVTIDRFLFNVQVLYGEIREADRKKSKIDNLEIAKDPFGCWHKIVGALDELGFFKQPRRVSHL